MTTGQLKVDNEKSYNKDSNISLYYLKDCLCFFLIFLHP